MTFRTKRHIPSNKDYNRKPYMEGAEGDYAEMMGRPTDKAVFNVRLEKQSEFKKPYMGDSQDYPEMEHWYPPPFPNFEWPNWTWPDFPGPVPEEGEWDESLPFGGTCSISCIGNGGSRECDAPIKCRVSRYASSAGGSWQSVRNRNGIIQEVGKIVPARGIWDVEIHPPGGSWVSNVPSGKQSFWVKMKYDEQGKSCYDEVIVYCLGCPPEVEFAFDDDSTSDTIVKNSNVDVVVTGGLPPYTWSVAGCEGYTWNSNGSSILTSSNTTEQLDCADGDCGVEFDPYVSIAITDSCETTVNATIRNTAGAWELYEDEVCTYPGLGSESEGNIFELVVGAYRQYQDVDGQGACNDTCESDLCKAWIEPTCTMCEDKCHDGGCDGWCCNPCIGYSTTFGQYLVPATYDPDSGPGQCIAYTNGALKVDVWGCP